MSKKWTPLWREAHFEAKMLKTLGFRTTFGGSDVASLHFTTLHYTTLHYTTLHYTTLPSATLHYITPHYTPLHYNYNHNNNYTPLHSTTLQLHYTPLQPQLQLHIATSKSGPKLVCFVHFDFKMCFAPQRRTLFRRRNFQKWSAPLVFCPL